jgi:hypothetical protein
MISNFKGFNLKIVIIAFCFLAAAPVFAQDVFRECEKIYQTISAYDGNLTLKEKLAIAKRYLEKCGQAKGQEEVYNYIKNQLPKLEQIVKDNEITAIETRYNTALKNKNADEMIAAAKELINLIQSSLLLEDCQKIYQKFLDNRGGPEVEKLKTAIAAGKEYLEKCSELKDQDEVKTYVTKQVQRIEENLGGDSAPVDENRFNNGLKNNNADEMIAAGKVLISRNRPYALDLMLDIASIGFDKAAANPPVDKYNDDGLRFAKLALQKINEGQISGNTDKYGFYHEYKTKECPDGKNNAKGWMNYIIGYIMSVRQKQTKEALPYLYQATQVGCETKGYSEPYRLIGAWYLDEAVKTNITFDSGSVPNKEDIALQIGLMERSLNAYARAYQLASSEQKPRLLKKVRNLYDFRYGDLTGLDSYLKNVMNTPFIDPATPVTPVPIK